MTDRATMTLVEFAYAAGVPYGVARDLLLTRKVEGTREGRNWLVFSDSANEYVARTQGKQVA